VLRITEQIIGSILMAFLIFAAKSWGSLDAENVGYLGGNLFDELDSGVC